MENTTKKSENMENEKMETTTEKQDFKFLVEQFGDFKIMRYKVNGFEDLSLQQKTLIYYLSQAAVAGRDIIWDQNYKHNLFIRKSLEEIYIHFEGDRNTDLFKAFELYLKKVWFANGIHHHYSMDKFKADFSREYLADLIEKSPKAQFPIKGEKADFIQKLTTQILDPEVAPKRLSLNADRDMIKSSACNFYERVTQKEADAFYEAQKDTANPHPVAYGLNSKLVKENGKLTEKIWKKDGMYSDAIKIFYSAYSQFMKQDIK
jgi:dipeptidyl-peptidase-3